jgi:hypothetical protein
MAKENLMPWTITKDFIADPAARQPSNANAVGMVGPCNAKLTAAQIIAHPEGRKFRIKDGDGEVYYEGVMVVTDDDGEETEFRPLDDFGKPNAGATDIEYQRLDGTWEMV